MHASWEMYDAGDKDAIKPSYVRGLVSLGEVSLGANVVTGGWPPALSSISIKHRE